MNTKKISYYVAEYIGTFPMCILHEVSHWLFALITFCLGLNSFPKIRITKYYSVEIKDVYDRINNNRMHVEYTTTNLTNKTVIVMCSFVASAPFFLTIFLFCYSPLWMYPYYLSNINSIWLSSSDVKQIKNIFQIKKELVINGREENL